MKPRLFHKLNSRLILILVIFMAAFVINSCRKETKKLTETSGVATGLINIDIDSLKAIYGNAIRTNAGLATFGTATAAINFIKSLDIDWNTYTVQKRPDGSIVAEFEIKNDTGLFVLKKLSLGDTIKYRNRTTVTFIKFKDGRRLNFFTKIIEDLNPQGSHSVIRQMHYNRIPATFGGLVLYFTLDRQFINGYHFTKGNPDGLVSFPADNGQTKVVNGVKTVNAAETCITYDVYQSYCTYGGTTANPYEYLQGCGEDYLGSYTVCSDDDGNDSGGVPIGGVSGDTGGGGGTAPNPCNPASSAQVQSISNGHLVIDVTTGGGSSGGTTSQPCPTTTLDTIKVTFCDGLTPAERASIQATIDAFKNEDCTSSFLYNYFDGQSFGFCISPGSYNVIFNPGNNTFTFSTDEAATPAFASLLEHEFFHAYQNATYPGGTNAYGKDPSTGVNGAGFVNIEFEQAVFNDIVNGYFNAFNNGTSAQQDAYESWIRGLTNNGTVYPKLTPGTAAYTTFLSEYNSFLDQYNDLPGNPNSSPIINLNPQAFINLFNSINPC